MHVGREGEGREGEEGMGQREGKGREGARGRRERKGGRKGVSLGILALVCSYIDVDSLRLE